MFSIICSFFLPAVAQNADACAFWKLTFNRDFRSTEFQEIKINSCPASAASWGQCLLRGVLRTTEIFGWRSSSSLTGCAPLPHTTFLGPTAAFPFFIKLFQLQFISRVLKMSYSLWSHTRVHWTGLCLGPTPQLQTSHPTFPHQPRAAMRISAEMSLPPAQAAIKMFGTAFPVVSVWTVKIKGEMWLSVPGFVLKPTITWRSSTFPRIFSVLTSGLQGHCCSQWHCPEMSGHPARHPRGAARF